MGDYFSCLCIKIADYATYNTELAIMYLFNFIKWSISLWHSPQTYNNSDIARVARSHVYTTPCRQGIRDPLSLKCDNGAVDSLTPCHSFSTVAQSQKVTLSHIHKYIWKLLQVSRKHHADPPFFIENHPKKTSATKYNASFTSSNTAKKCWFRKWNARQLHCYHTFFHSLWHKPWQTIQLKLQEV